MVTRVSSEENGPLPKIKCPLSLCSKVKVTWTSGTNAIVELTEDLWSPFQKFKIQKTIRNGRQVTEADGDKGSTPSYCHKK